MNPYTLTDAEAALRAALDDGDPTKIDAATTALERLEPRPPQPAPLHAAALWYAEQGIPTFALSPGSKIPFKGSRGLKDATTDPEQINAWWTANPEANIGVATGHVFDVVDIDGHPGVVSRAQRRDVFDTIEADHIAKVLTPSPGGMHLYVPATGDGNSAGILPGVDYRGVGGYVVAPPSRTPAGSYRFLGAPRLNQVGQVAA